MDGIPLKPDFQLWFLGPPSKQALANLVKASKDGITWIAWVDRPEGPRRVPKE